MAKFSFTALHKSHRLNLLIFSPDHLIHNPHVALNNLDDFSADIFIAISRHSQTVITICMHRYRQIHRLDHIIRCNRSNNKDSLIHSFRAFRRSANRHCRKLEIGTLFWNRAAIRNHTESILLKPVICKKSERLMLYHP